MMQDPTYMDKTWPEEKSHHPSQVSFLSTSLSDKKVDPLREANSTGAYLTKLTWVGEPKC